MVRVHTELQSPFQVQDPHNSAGLKSLVMVNYQCIRIERKVTVLYKLFLGLSPLFASKLYLQYTLNLFYLGM